MSIGSIMSTLVVYYSHHGNNATLANHLCNRLQCGSVAIVETKPRTNRGILFDVLFRHEPRIQRIEKALDDYDHVIVVGPVWAGRIAAPLKSFFRQYGSRLADYSFITLCGYERPKQRAWLGREMTRVVGRPPRAVCELRVSDLVAPEQRRNLRIINGYRVEESELACYETAIDEFLSASRALRARPSIDRAQDSQHSLQTGFNEH